MFTKVCFTECLLQVMSRHCIHQLRKLQQFSQADSISRLSRGISTTPPVLKDDKDADSKEKKESEESPEGFLARFKKEFMKDLKTDDKNKETFHELQKKIDQLQEQYDKYVGSNLPKSMPAWPKKSDKDESEEIHVPKITVRERAETLKLRLQKERLQEDYENLIQFAKTKSESSYDKMRQWRENEKPDQKEVQENEETAEPAKPNIVQSKFQDLFEKSGIAENPIYQKARAQTESVIKVGYNLYNSIFRLCGQNCSHTGSILNNN